MTRWCGSTARAMRCARCRSRAGRCRRFGLGSPRSGTGGSSTSQETGLALPLRSDMLRLSGARYRRSLIGEPLAPAHRLPYATDRTPPERARHRRGLRAEAPFHEPEGGPMSRSSCTTIALALVLCAGPAFAQAKFQFAVPNFRAPDSPDVSGMRLSLLWGENQSQRGFDAGLLSLSETSTFSGMGLILGV